MKNIYRLMVGVLVAGTGAWAASPWREAVSFSFTNDAGYGNEIYVTGSHPDLGAWTATGAVKLRWTTGNVWTGQVGVQAGQVFEYKYVSRETTADRYCDDANINWLSPGNLTNATPAQPAAPYSGKTFFYYSGWTNASVVYRMGTNWHDAPMERLGQGRSAGEYYYRVSGIGEAGEALEFIPHGWLGGVEYWDHAPYSGYGSENYYTALDVFFLQDGHVYNYRPPAEVSASRIFFTNIVSSWAPAIPSRDVKIYLPRGYTQNTWRRYPVLYMHDGQNLFYPDAGLGGSWNVQYAADREISQGRMRETIIVGVYCRPTGDDRIIEYLPPSDSYLLTQGKGDLYANFLIHNVRPTVDWNFRTLTDPPNTLTLGSSMGGLISFYLGFTTNMFGKIGPMATAFWIAPNFMDWMGAHNNHGPRVYMDWSTLEDDFDNCWWAYGDLLADGYVRNKDLKEVLGCGQRHNESAWSNRLPGALGFLLDVRDEPNLLAQEIYPPAAGRITLSGGQAGLECTTLRGFQYQLQEAADPTQPVWAPVTNSAVETMPWAVQTFSAPVSGLSAAFLRVTATNAP